MMRKWLFGALLSVAWCSAAFAASTCSVKEYDRITNSSNAGAAQAAQEPALVDQGDIDFTAGHAESAAFNAATKFIRVICYSQAAFLVGTAPVATTTMSWIATGGVEYFGVLAGHKISFVAKP